MVQIRFEKGEMGIDSKRWEKGEEGGKRMLNGE